MAVAVRAKALVTAAFSAIVAIAACDDEAKVPAAATPGPVNAGAGGRGAGGAATAAGSGGGVDPDDVPTLTADEATTRRAACAFGPGSKVAATMGQGVRIKDQIPIEHVVLLMLENRSFDHMLQRLPDVGVTDADVAPDDFANPDAGGASVPMHRATAYCFDDTNHAWGGVHQQLDDGKMDGFVKTNSSGGKDGTRAMAYLTPDDAPFAYWLAQNATIGDRYFCALPGSTWPNRAYFYAASSFGILDNDFPPKDETTIFEQLLAAKVEWKVYRTDIPGAGAFLATVVNNSERFVPVTDFMADAAAGTLPPVSYVDPMLNPGTHVERMSTDQHPPSDHQYGEQLVWDVANALATSPLWGSSALIVTYDEHGGLFDHVMPPKACAPDDLAPPADQSEGYGFDRLGVRVPFFVFSAYARPGRVSHTVYDHTSVLRFLEAKFGLGALSKRDANANPITDAFDFDSPPRPAPTLPPRPTIDADEDAACAAAFP